MRPRRPAWPASDVRLKAKVPRTWSRSSAKLSSGASTPARGRPVGGRGAAAACAQAEGRGGHGAMPPWLGIWLTASTAWVRELTPSARSTAATWSFTVSTERLSSRAISLFDWPAAAAPARRSGAASA